jgi:hypothetical protein
MCSEVNSAKLRVENLHYDLTEEDLDVGHERYWEGTGAYQDIGSL